MTVLAAVMLGVFVYLAVGYIVGYAPTNGFRRRPKAQVGGRQLWLTQAGVQLTPSRFWAISLGAGGAAFLFVVLITGLPAVAVVPSAAASLVPWAYFSRRRAKRLREVQEAWPDGLRDLIASISSGMSLPRAIEAMSDQGPAPLRDAFERFPLLSRTVGVVPALDVIKEQLADPTSDRVIEVLIIAHERGGSLVVDILRDLADMCNRDIWTAEQIRSASLEQKINARVVFVLPWLVLVALTATPGAFRDFYATSGGMAVVAVAGVASAGGIALVARLGKEPSEPRVIGGSAISQGNDQP